ncbi:MAG: hypothetical protein NTY02_06315 [Acidobacteria bacterium]|nr:hypothetical protein [Acidobacteriota bacterium]
MSMETEPVTPSQIWREMTTEQRTAAAQAFWTDGESVPQQVEAVQAIARQLHFRPQSVLKLPVERRTHHLAAIHKVSESLASRMLVVYHLETRRPLLEAFLDRLGIAHEHGLIAESAAHTPAPEKLREAANALRDAFPPADVRVYLRTLAAQDPETWGGLVGIVSEWPAV